MILTMTILGSGSTGNGYILNVGDESLILECGVQAEKALKALDYDISNVKGVLVTHTHADHAKYIHKYAEYVTVYTSFECHDKYPETQPLVHLHKYRIGGFTVLPLEVPHSCHCYAYVIDHANMGRMCFITDATAFPYKIPNVSHWCIEANYSQEILMNALFADSDVRSQSQWHMSIDDAINVVRSNYSGQIRDVFLLHLSSALSDAANFEKRFKDELCLNAHAVKNGEILTLSNEDF